MNLPPKKKMFPVEPALLSSGLVVWGIYAPQGEDPPLLLDLYVYEVCLNSACAAGGKKKMVLRPEGTCNTSSQRVWLLLLYCYLWTSCKTSWGTALARDRWGIRSINKLINKMYTNLGYSHRQPIRLAAKSYWTIPLEEWVFCQQRVPYGSHNSISKDMWSSILLEH